MVHWHDLRLPVLQPCCPHISKQDPSVFRVCGSYLKQQFRDFVVAVGAGVVQRDEATEQEREHGAMTATFKQAALFTPHMST